ncbi:MAG: acetolactate synthase small subunit [Bifidobacteriaceae bacterium]|jgi:acetolactate synthase-1/3 small subunit|nr:acetolactate synthase small subunit [Bifidobacteriaceae bacterium]
MSQHTLSVLVENRPGVLARVAALFSRRNFNIASLAVGPTEHESISRITVVADAEDTPLEQITKQLNKLVNVLKIVELEDTASVKRELLLVKVRADAQTRGQIIEVVNLFRASVVDVAPDSLVIEVTGSGQKLEAMMSMLDQYGIREFVKSGVVGIARGPRSMTDKALASR